MRQAIRESDRVEPCSDIAHICGLIVQGRVSEMIWNTGPMHERDLRLVIDAMSHTAFSAGLLLRVSPHDDLCSLLALLPSAVRARLSLRAPDDLSTDLSALRAQHGSDCAIEIARTMMPIRVTRSCEILHTAAIVGRHRQPVGALAIACGSPVRTIDWRLLSDGLPSARQILGWCVILHVLWQIALRRESAKAIASRAGFSSVAAFSSFASRYIGPGPIAQVRDGGLPALFMRFRKLLIQGRLDAELSHRHAATWLPNMAREPAHVDAG